MIFKKDEEIQIMGFTLIELIIVVALVFMFAGLALPVGFNFYQETTLTDQAKILENSLKRAQAMAITGRNGESAGVKIIPEENKFVIFEGETFKPEKAELTIPFATALSISGPDEIVFQKLTGLPVLPESESSLSVTLTFGKKSQEININSQGKIERYEKAKE